MLHRRLIASLAVAITALSVAVSAQQYDRFNVATRPGVLIVSTTPGAGTPASTTETDLWSYSLPANTLNVDGKSVRVTLVFTCAANANTKRARLKFGATTILDSGAIASNAGPIYMTVQITRTGATAQLVFGSTQQQTVLGVKPEVATTAETLSGAIAIVATGQNGTASANDLVFRGAIVEALW